MESLPYYLFSPERQPAGSALAVNPHVKSVGTRPTLRTCRGKDSVLDGRYECRHPIGSESTCCDVCCHEPFRTKADTPYFPFQKWKVRGICLAGSVRNPICHVLAHSSGGALAPILLAVSVIEAKLRRRSEHQDRSSAPLQNAKIGGPKHRPDTRSAPCLRT